MTFHPKGQDVAKYLFEVTIIIKEGDKKIILSTSWATSEEPGVAGEPARVLFDV